MSKTTRRVRVAYGAELHTVGEVVFESDGRREMSLFRYAPSWLESASRFAIAPALPLSETPFHHSGAGPNRRSALPGPVADSAPDTWGRSLIRKAQGRGLTELDYLLAADDTTRQGALRYVDDAGQPLAQTTPTVPRLRDLAELRALAQKSEAELELTPAELDLLVGNASSLGGARPKASIRDNDGHLAIGKFTAQQDTLPVERVEVAALALAREVGISAATARLELGRTDRPVALIRRFDRRGESRIGYLSAQSFIDAEHATGAFYTDIADALRTHGEDPKAQLTELYRRILFTILVSNNDDHLKNHGLLHVSSGRWVLAPAFDINPQPHRQRHLETGISDLSGNAASVEAALEAAPFFDIERTTAAKVLADMAATIDARWRNHCREVGLTAQQIAHYRPAFDHEEHDFARRLSSRGWRR